MSTIDMTQVAGIQAVNAEGKVIGTLSVDYLTELVATKIVREAKNEAVSARSASVMSEASTIAATDEYEDQLELDTNPAYVRSLDSEGNPKRTATTSLATVVGELLPIKRLSSEQKYPVNVPALSQVNIELKSEYTYLISVEYPYSDSSALLYIPQTRHKIYSITSDLPSGIVFSLREDGNLVISSTNYPYGLKVTLLAF